MVAGIAAGLARYFGVDRTLMRVGFALLLVFTGLFPGVVVYLVMWLLVPQRPPGRPPVAAAP